MLLLCDLAHIAVPVELGRPGARGQKQRDCGLSLCSSVRPDWLCSMPLRATQRAAISQAPRMSYSPVPTPEGTKETYWETKAPSSEVRACSAAQHCWWCQDTGFGCRRWGCQWSLLAKSGSDAVPC